VSGKRTRKCGQHFTTESPKPLPESLEMAYIC